MAFTLLDDQQVVLTVVGVDDAGNQVPAALDAPVSAGSSDETIVTVAVNSDATLGATDGSAVVVTAVGALGDATVTLSGSGGGGTIPLSATFDLTVSVSAETNFAVVPGTPQHKP